MMSADVPKSSVALDSVAKGLQLLVDAINSVAADSEDIFDQYRHAAAMQILNLSAAFHLLQSRRFGVASLQMVRPVLELKFKLAAIKKEPESLFRIYFSESRDQRKWLRALDGNGFTPGGFDAKLDADEQNFVAKYKTNYPSHNPSLLIENGITTEKMAEIAGLSGVYHTHYRLFCRHSHGNFEALLGGLAEIGDPSIVIVASLLEAIDAMVSCGADAEFRREAAAILIAF